MTGLAEAIRAALLTGEPRAKVKAARALVRASHAQARRQWG